MSEDIDRTSDERDAGSLDPSRAEEYRALHLSLPYRAVGLIEAPGVPLVRGPVDVFAHENTVP